MREAPLPVTQSTQLNFQDSLLMNHSNMSVGAYFKNRCPEFGRILAKTDSPDRSMQPSITDVSSHVPVEPTEKFANQTFKLDNTLDSVPVKQPKVPNNENTVQPTLNNEKVMDKPNNSIMNMSSIRNMDPPRSDRVIKGLNMSSASLAPSSAKKLNQIPNTPKSFMTSSKPTDVLLRNLQSSLRMVTEDTEGSMENSLSISKIADYLGKQSNISITDMLQLNNQTKQPTRKQPLTELHINMLENKRMNQDVPVTHLKDTKKAETASSSGTVNTVISLDKLKFKDENEVPSVIVTQDLEVKSDGDVRNSEQHSVRTQSLARSKSPSSKSQSTLSTVQENIMSFKSADSPTHSSREKWADILATSVNGFVGVSCVVTITVSTLTDSWLTAKFEFDDLPNDGQDLTIELPRLPLLLSPGKTEQFTLHLTSNVEMDTKLPFTMYLKDASIDGDIEQKGFLDVNIKMPTIQAISCDGVNKISFPIVQEKSILTKYFVLISDCPVDLKLELAITEGDSMFVIKNVQEIKRNEVSKALMDRQGSVEEQALSKPKGKGTNKQLCRLTNENAIKVTITFNSPKLSDLDISEKLVTFTGSLNVNLIGLNTVLKKVGIVGTVGIAKLAVQTSSEKIQLSTEPVSVNLTNTGSTCGSWIVKFKSSAFTESNFPFKVSPSKFEIEPGCSSKLNMVYAGPEEVLNEATLILEDIVTGNITSINISGGTDKPKTFPIKTNFNNMSWVSAGRKELSLKNFSNKKVQMRCQILGEGFSIDLPGMESRGIYCLAFGPCECRPLPIVFTPTSNKPYIAALHIVFDKNSNFSRKIKLHGCAGGSSLRWAGLVTYGDTALVRALLRCPIDLTLYNKSSAPAFVAASVHFNLQYACVSSGASLQGARRVVRGRARLPLSLRVDWPRLERRARQARATALASVTVIAGPEYTRRRILRILRSESTTGELDTSLLPDHLKVLTDQFEGEDPNMDKQLENFRETKASLNDLIESLQELTAQIDLPQDFADDNTIIISDDTMVEHHTLCD
ncbi:uncharacterized protein spd-2 isoform X1 [Epargyreus clarus]|uniref:uncharacterized protein spd-2 isoform X1 n=1 Tax=Epargyreus clarus TaxID=520877 RepID=UPI003C30653B